MPLLDIAIAHSSFLKHLDYTRLHLFINGNRPNYSLLQHEERWASFRKSLQNTRNLKFGLIHLKKSCPGFLVSAVATLEPQCLVQNKDREKESNALFSAEASKSETVQSESLTGDSEDIDERERLRRLRISKANKGNTPWNKGRRHSPETLRRIKERTKLAMQSPKVKMKLANLGHAQSTETRVKIAVGVRMGWQRRREKLILQETCLLDWQNLVAEAAREGFQGEEELQWDSYDILSKKFQQEWLDGIEQRKTVPRVRGSKRAPKSLEQRKKIAEAIAAKWADPEYRSRVRSGIAKYHGIAEGAERKVKKKPSGEDSTSTSRKKSYMDRLGVSGRIQLPKPKKRNVPKYKDPLAKTKLEMLKSIRAERVASETKKIEALERAKLLIAEAQKAAKALEVAATRSPVARASLIEAQRLIAEATQSIESIENGDPSSQNDAKSEHQDYVERGGETLSEDVHQEHHIGVNGIKEIIPANVGQRYYNMVDGASGIVTEKADQTHHTWVNGVESLQLGVESLQLSEGQNLDTDLFKLTTVDEVDQNVERDNIEENLDLKQCMKKQYPDANGALGLNGCSSINGVKFQTHEEHALPAVKTVAKKWVRGRLIEVEEESKISNIQ